MLPFEAAAIFCSGTASLVLAAVLLFARPRKAHTRRIIAWSSVHFLGALCIFAALVLRPESEYLLHIYNALLLGAGVCLLSFVYLFPGSWHKTEGRGIVLAAAAGLLVAATAVPAAAHFRLVPAIAARAGILLPPALCALWILLVFIRRRKLASTRPERKKFDAFAAFTGSAGIGQILMQYYLINGRPVWLYAGAGVHIIAVILAFRAIGIHSREGISLKVKLLVSVVFIVFLMASGVVPVAALDSQRTFDQQRAQDIRATAAELSHDDFLPVPVDVQYVAEDSEHALLFNRSPVSEETLTASESERQAFCSAERLFTSLDNYQRCSPQRAPIRFVDTPDGRLEFAIYRTTMEDVPVEVAFPRGTLLAYQHRKAGYGILLIAGCSLVMMLVTFLMYERMVFRPLQWLVDGIQRLNKGDLTARVRSGARDEIGYAIRWFNRMTRAMRLRTEEMRRNNERLDRDKRILQKFFSSDFLDQVLEEKISHNLGGDRLPATILFLDIRNSTSIAEQIDPAVFSQFLSEIFTDVMDLVYGNHGSVNKLIGDGLLATFGCPVRTDKPALDAMHCALAIRDYMATFNEVRPDFLKEPVRIGMGIASGVVFAGNTGSVRRMEYTVLGDAVNIASRLESLTKVAGVDIFIDGTTAAQLAGAAKLRRVRLNKVRGKIQEIEIYFLAGLAASPN